MAEKLTDEVLLMFSGGRDSTLAAFRLHEAGHPLALVTITAGHLYGLNNVERRLRELAQILPPDTEWLQIVQPALRDSQRFFHQQTCLPCQSAYVVTGVTVAREKGLQKIAMGYASYQAEWPEQGPQATKILKSTLMRYGFDLMLPVYDVASRADVIEELKIRGVSELALEQKCTRQVTNVELEDSILSEQLGLWAKAIDEELGRSKLLLSVSGRVRLGDLK